MHRSHVENDLAPLCQEFGIGLTTFSPLYNGILSGKYNDGIPKGSRAAQTDMGWIQDRITPSTVDKVRQLTDLAGDLDATTAQLAIAWVLRRKEVSSVITGATRLEQLDENLAAADFAGQLSDDLLDKIDMIFHEGE